MASSFQGGNLVPNVLKAGKNTAHFNPIMLCHRIYHVGRNNGRHGHRIFRHFAFFLFRGGNEVQQQYAHFVARHQLVTAMLIHRNTHPVAVRVSGQQQVRLYLFAQFQSFLQRFADFRVRERTRGEVAIGFTLFRYDSHIADPNTVQNAGYAHFARAVEGRIDHFQRTGGLAHAYVFDGIQVRVHYIIADHFDQATLFPVFERHGLYIGKNIQAVDFILYVAGHFRRNLAAVAAIAFISVIFGRVMAGRYANTGVAVQIPHSKRQGRRGHELGIQIGFDPIGCQYGRRFFRKQCAVNTAIIPNGYSGYMTLCFMFIEIIGKALRCFPYRIDIHPVGASSQHAPQPSRTKRQVLIKAVIDFIGFVLYAFEFFGQRRIFQLIGQPLLVFSH